MCARNRGTCGDEKPGQRGECEAIPENRPQEEDCHVGVCLLAESNRVQMQHGPGVKGKKQEDLKTWRNWSSSKLLR